ncbi:peptidase inhibitor family I36 protein [Actinomadura oligospora]|uniref:peptidase inhibitor family I36 protein n=1 Tax=Actinomadura oligospora TaxID=111804 RepID=UPI00055788A4|nr:peptidase inhibitor family I36 protein [Actinomadura oligospora]
MPRRIPAGRTGTVIAVVTVLAVGIPAVPARAFSVCSPGWSCVFGDNGEQDGLWATNNPSYDHDFAGDQVNDRTRSAVNMGGGYMGLYRDSPYQGLVACLGPKTRNYHIPAGTVTGIRYHPSRTAACGASARKPSAKHSPAKPPTTAKHTPKTDTASPDKAKDKVKAVPTPSDAPSSLPLPQPTSSAQLPQVAQGSPGAGVNVAATSAAGNGKSGGGDVIAIVGAAAGGLLMAGLLVAGVLFARRRKEGVPAGRPETGPEAARTVDRGLRLLAVDCEEAGRAMPGIRAVGLADGRLTVLLTTPDTGAPEPWKADPGGTCWRLASSEITELTDDVRDAPAPLPLLAPVGPGMWVDLRSVPGPISLSGSRSAVRRATRTLADGLRASPWTRGVRIRTVGSADVGPVPEADEGEERGRVVFVADDMKVPRTAPPGGVVIALGKVVGAGTRWPVRADGTLRVPEQIPAEPTLKDQARPAPAAPTGPTAADSAAGSPMSEGESAK